MKQPLVALLALAVLTLAAGCEKKEAAQTAGADTVAVVNGHELSRAVFDMYVKNRTGHNAKDLGATDKAKLLDDLIEMVLLADAPRAEDTAAKSRIDAQVELTRIALGAQQKAEELAKAEPTEAELKTEYDAQVKLMAGRSEYLTRHIVVDSKEKADALVKQIQGGADFLKLARQNSTDPETQQGVVFWVGTDPAEKIFADAMQPLKKGDVAPAPVQSQFGWHVIRLDDVRGTNHPAFEQVKPQIAQRMQAQMVEKFVQDLRTKSKIQ
jgi:peptidyl-prolyl cis-trans isomerase C